MMAKPKKWYVIAPFIKSRHDRWLHSFIGAPDLQFLVVPASYEHDRSRSTTNGRQWLDYFRHSVRLFSTILSQGDVGKVAGIVTNFPQLAVTTGVLKRVSGCRCRLVAWLFNLGAVYHGPKGKLARFALQGVDCFVVHSRHEIKVYSQWLNLPESRFRFVPLQRAFIPRQYPENKTEPFIVALGSAHRDYKTLIEVARQSGYKMVIVCGPHAVEGLSVPDNVTILFNQTLAVCHQLLQEAWLSVTPIDNDETASGQVTVIDAMMYGVPAVATDCVGTRDYIAHGKNGMLVAPGSVSALQNAIDLLWRDTALRQRMGVAAMQYVREELSDEKTAQVLAEILESI